MISLCWSSLLNVGHNKINTEFSSVVITSKKDNVLLLIIIPYKVNVISL